MRALRPVADIIDTRFWGNPLSAYLLAVLIFVGSLWAFFIVRRLILQKLKSLAARTSTDLDDFVVELLHQIRIPECYLVALYLATRSLALPLRFDGFLRTATLVVVAYRLVRMTNTMAAFAVRRLVYKDGSDPARKGAANALSLVLQSLIWAGAILFVLSNLGFNVTSVVAGLGIGGVAVALGAQAVLGDLFAALAIFLDKPFEIGDFIIFGEGKLGTVEHIGIKTTRIRALSGEELVVSNSVLTSGFIRNFRRMSERRVVFKFGVVYSTSEKDLAATPELVKQAVAADPMLRFDRAHFMNFGDSSLDFEVVFWILDPDYNKYMDSQQRVLLSLVREFRARGIDFAFPTRTVVLEGAKSA